MVKPNETLVLCGAKTKFRRKNMLYKKIYGTAGSGKTNELIKELDNFTGRALFLSNEISIEELIRKADFMNVNLEESQIEFREFDDIDVKGIQSIIKDAGKPEILIVDGWNERYDFEESELLHALSELEVYKVFTSCQLKASLDNRNNN